MNTPAPDAVDDSAILEAVMDDHNSGSPIVVPGRHIRVQRHSHKRDIMTYGSLAVGFLTIFTSLIMGYSRLCHDVENAVKATEKATEAQATYAEEVRVNSGEINQIKVTLERVDTTQQAQKENLKTRMDRQDVVLDRIFNKLDNN